MNLIKSNIFVSHTFFRPYFIRFTSWDANWVCILGLNYFFLTIYTPASYVVMEYNSRCNFLSFSVTVTQCDFLRLAINVNIHINFLIMLWLKLLKFLLYLYIHNNGFYVRQAPPLHFIYSPQKLHIWLLIRQIMLVIYNLHK
jgi:hypothetical protein